MSRLSVLASVVALLVGSASGQGGVVIETVTVGNPGNADDIHGAGYGAVGYAYNIGKYEVTAGQYTEFLNAVAATDTYELYSVRMADLLWYGSNIRRTGTSGSYTYSVADDWADRPANNASWGDAARFSNWLHNGQPTGAQGLDTTEDGSYYLNGATNWLDLNAVVRSEDATWVIPTENEWYKAAYHKNNGVTNNYYDYPTSSDLMPNNNLVEPTDPGNNATFYDGEWPEAAGYTIGSPYYRTEVGAHENSESPYGTFDQGGNVWEWTEATPTVESRRIRGGSFTPDGDRLHAAYRLALLPSSERINVGFRVAEVPEPTTLVLLIVGAGAVVLRRMRVAA